VVLHLGERDAVALAEVRAAPRPGDQVERLGRIAGEDGLARRRAREGGDPAARALEQLRRLLGELVRSMSTTSGSAIVPQVWAGQVIDRARNLSAVMRAGGQLVPMDAKTVNIGRLITDPTAAFRTEGSTVTASDPVFDSGIMSGANNGPRTNM
jgi:HK97 family phage major capsid protein